MVDATRELLLACMYECMHVANKRDALLVHSHIRIRICSSAKTMVQVCSSASDELRECLFSFLLCIIPIVEFQELFV